LTLIWRDTLGGPFVVVSATVLPQWTGTEGADYDRACQVDDEVAVVALASGDEVLVLGDEPMSTAVLPEHRVIARWCYTETRDGVSDLITTMLAGAQWSEGPAMRISGPVVIFDAAFLGTDVGTLIEGLILDLDAGRYRVESTVVEPDRQTRFLLHRFSSLA
jgi:hypothetical protein